MDCAGFYYLWGEKIDLASGTDLVLVVGLCVDYTVRNSDQLLSHKLIKYSQGITLM